MITSFYLLLGIVGYSLDHNTWLREIIFGYQPEQLIDKEPWWKVWRIITKPAGAVTREILQATDIVFRGLIFLCAYCLAWAAFDRRSIEGYIMGIFNIILGLVYILSPTDVIPDVLPVIGSIDDTIFSFGMTSLGTYVWYRNSMREQKTTTILEMVKQDDILDHRNVEKALQLLLEDRGVHIEFLNEEVTSKPKLPPSQA
ncbi:YkvA family protein [Sphaerothrix gracilis]|uniref:YkvA family protein n=1 Tax=Sphaerothrix gracilis TaxID=3151835 RepID=UPI0031FCE2F1